MAHWMVAHKGADFQSIAAQCGISPVMARLIRNRDVIGPEETMRFLHGRPEDMHDPHLLPGMDDAVRILLDKIRSGRRIRIIGDYDVDGICASYILHSVLSFLGADNDIRLPERLTDGYGINERLVSEALQEGVDTILTCDNGIAAMDALAGAKEAGMTVIVTDHHEIPFEDSEDGIRELRLPPSDAVVEPKLPDCDGMPAYPFPDICGAAVAYKLAQVLLEQHGDIEAAQCNGSAAPAAQSAGLQQESKALMEELLGFCALATVCDVMPLKDENRIIVKYGLREIEKTRNIGLRALLTASGLTDTKLSCYHAGFIIGPCLNASGRLDSASRALELFEMKEEAQAMYAASELRALNESRKSLTEQGVQQALSLAREAAGRRDRVLVLYLPELHESLAGIVAGRIRERFSRPVFVLTDCAAAHTPDSCNGEDLVKGSGRSIEAYDMYASLHECADLFVKFGGHKMAAGITLKKDNIETLSRRLNDLCVLDDDQLQDTIHIDMELPPAYATMQFTEEMKQLEPCGTGNPKPVFAARSLRICLDTVVGKKQNVLKFRGYDEQNRQYDMVWFTTRPEAGIMADGREHLCHVVYYPDINEFRGTRKLQLVIMDARLAQT